MAKPRHIAMEDPRLKATSAFGGILFRKLRYRTSRPLCTKRSIHLVLRSSQAKGALSFHVPKNRRNIERLCFEFAAKYRVRVQHFANGGNHLHLIIKLRSKEAYAHFIRALTGAVALKLTGANRHRGNEKRFWDFRPFTSLVEREPQYSIAKDYVTLNLLQSLQVIPAKRLRLRGCSNSIWSLNTS